MAVKAVKKEPAKSAEPEASPAPKSGKSKGKLILVLVLLLVAGGGGAAYWFLHKESGTQEAKSHPDKPPVFQPLDAFTVNLQIEDNPQFLQTAMTLKVADNEAADAIKQRMPEVRSTVLLLLSARKASEILSVDGKRKLGADIVTALNAIFNPPATRPAATARKGTPPDGAAEAEAATAAEPATPPDEAATSDEPKSQPLVLDVLFTSFIVQ